MRLVIAGGGTGGHLFPGLAIAEELLARQGSHAVLFMGARGGLEERVIPRHGHRLELLPSLKGGLVSLDLARKTWHACRGYLQARRILLDFQPQAVVGLGGYASALPILAAWGVELPCMILEQNAIPGQVTRKLCHLANEIGVQFKESGKRLSHRGRLKHTGNPLRAKMLEASIRASRRNLAARPAPEEPGLLVAGGSQGARFLNELLVQTWPKLKRNLPGLRVMLVSGPEDYARTSGAFAAAGVRGQVLPFTEKMEELYLQADVALARAGATTLAELSAFALPSILVPYPHAADDHQTANAQIFASAGAAWALPQAELEVDRLVQRVADVVLQPERRRQMASAAASLAKPYAAAEVVDRLERMAGLRQFETGTYRPGPPCTPDAVHVCVA